MAVSLDHTIVSSHDPAASAAFLSRILGVAPPAKVAHFWVVELANGVSLDYDQSDRVEPQHYAFLVDDHDFDPIFDRVRQEEVSYFPDAGHSRPGKINRRDGARGFYFPDPDGHNLEVLTRPYGSP